MPALGLYATGGPYIGQPCGYQQISAVTLAAATGLTVPANAKYAFIQVDTAPVRWRDDATNPTASVGIQLAAAGSFWYYGNLAAIKFILASGSPVLNVSYYF